MRLHVQPNGWSSASFQYWAELCLCSTRYLEAAPISLPLGCTATLRSSCLSSSQNPLGYFSWKSLRNLTAWKVISSRLLLLKEFINFFINETDSSCIIFSSSASLNQLVCKYLEDSKKQQQAYMSLDEVVKPTVLQQAFYPALGWFRKKKKNRFWVCTVWNVCHWEILCQKEVDTQGDLEVTRKLHLKRWASNSC